VVVLLLVVVVLFLIGVGSILSLRYLAFIEDQRPISSIYIRIRFTIL
jgi:hypothetical protein